MLSEYIHVELACGVESVVGNVVIACIWSDSKMYIYVAVGGK